MFWNYLKKIPEDISWKFSTHIAWNLWTACYYFVWSIKIVTVTKSKIKRWFVNWDTFNRGTNCKTLQNIGQLFTTHSFCISNYHYCSLLFPSTSKNIYWIVCVNPKHDNLTWYEKQFTIFTYLFIEAPRYILCILQNTNPK